MRTYGLPWDRPPLTGNRTRGNPYARAAEVKRAKADVVGAIRMGRDDPVPTPVQVGLHFRPATNHRRDTDGLSPTLKVCLDALVACGVISPDDSWKYVPRVFCEIHAPTSTGQTGAMWLTVEPWEAA